MMVFFLPVEMCEGFDRFGARLTNVDDEKMRDELRTVMRYCTVPSTASCASYCSGYSTSMYGMKKPFGLFENK